MSKSDPVNHAIEEVIQQYFADLEGEEPCAVYEMVMNKVEKILIQTVTGYANNNQTRAAKILGLNRNTLRKKLKQYGLD